MQVEFIIEVQGIPPPAIQWFVDAEEVGPEHAKMKVIRDESGISSLVLNDAQDGDGGEIKCIATNDIGLATTTASLNVEGIFFSTDKVIFSVIINQNSI